MLELLLGFLKVPFFGRNRKNGRRNIGIRYFFYSHAFDYGDGDRKITSIGSVGFQYDCFYILPGGTL